MSLFTPKLPKHELPHVQNLLHIAQDSAKLVNETVNPDVFFGRLNMFLDVLLQLEQYEKYKILTGPKPSVQYRETLDKLGATVDLFITRSYQHALNSANTLKTEKGRQNRMRTYADKMLSAFAVANTFWTGNMRSPHYSGPLYTSENYQRLLSVLEPYI